MYSEWSSLVDEIRGEVSLENVLNAYPPHTGKDVVNIIVKSLTDTPRAKDLREPNHARSGQVDHGRHQLWAGIAPVGAQAHAPVCRCVRELAFGHPRAEEVRPLASEGKPRCVRPDHLQAVVTGVHAQTDNMMEDIVHFLESHERRKEWDRYLVVSYSYI